MKIVHKVCCGVDVHKKVIVATIATTNDENITTYKTRDFPTFTSDLYAFARWLSSNNCSLVCMESTGKYFIPVYRILEECGLKPFVAHPKFLRAIPGQKTDRKDSKWIADLFKHGLVPFSYIPSRQIFELRDLTRYHSKLTNLRCGEKNRIQNSLTVSNIMLSSVVSDSFGKAASAILKYTLDNPDQKDIDYSQFMQRRMKATPEDIAKAMDGSFSPEQAKKLKIAYSHLDSLNLCLDNLNTAISLLSKPFEKQIELLCTMDGITPNSAVRIIAEIGNDMSVFLDSKHLCSWAGLSPQCNESAGKKKSVHISHAGQYLKPLLVQCALAAVKIKDSYFSFKYQALSKRRGKKRAIIAIARMMLTSIYHMLLNNVPFNAELYNEYLHNATHKFGKLSVSKVIQFLNLNGFSVTDLQSGEVFTST